MAIQKLSGNKVILGGIDTTALYGAITLPSCSVFYGTMRVKAASTDTTKGALQLGGMAMVIKKIALTAGLVNTGTTSVYDTTWNLPRFAIVDDVWVQTVTAATSATNTLTVGITDNTNGFLTTVTPTSAFQPTNVAGYGTLLKSRSTTFESRVPYYVNSSTGVSVVLTRSATTFSATWVGNLYIKYYVPST
jgi:hypothetical protein